MNDRVESSSGGRLFAAGPSIGSPGRFRAPETPLGLSVDGPRPREVRLAPGYVAWLRLMPKFDPGRSWSVAELARAATKGGLRFAPFGMGRGAYDIGLLAGRDGFGVWVTQGRDQTLWTSFVFRTGEIWGVDALSMNTDRSLIQFDPTMVAGALAGYRDLLNRLGACGPYRWIAGLEGTRNRRFELASRASLYPPEGRAAAEEIRAEGEMGESQDTSEAGRAWHVAVRVACGLDPEA